MSHEYIATIGLEIHAQLNTQRKMFAPEAVVYGALPNTYVSEVTLAHPGVLPTVNEEAIRQAIVMGLACKSVIASEVSFYRKNYFYPDLPKGYQITQGEVPICKGGEIIINLSNSLEKAIDLERIHIEEDTGKSIHSTSTDETFLDFNRAGSPLIEIVTKPCMTTSEEAYSFLTEVRKLVRYLEICDGNMEEGSLRCDVNISVMPRGSTIYGQRVEIKNLNSIRNVQMAIDYEINRHISLLESGKVVDSETRSYNPDNNTTTCLRIKNSASDYRYFPEPNLPPILLSEGYLSEIRTNMPLLPRECMEKFTKEYSLSHYDATVITSSKELALYFDAVCKFTKNYKSAANWIMGPIKGYINDLNVTIDAFPITPEKIAALVDIVQNGTISFFIASQQVFPHLIQNPKASPLAIAKELNLVQSEDIKELNKIICSILEQYPDKVEAYKAGKTGVIEMLMGQVMKKSGGRISPKIARELMIGLMQ
jgi:aspartyl-tRNA(Asn)/glutamyl-tRNA(Gln) amidotransferase subunit B